MAAAVKNDFDNAQNDYRRKRQDVVPEYKFAKITQQTGGQAVTIGSATQESIFELPPRVLNFNRSELKFTATPTAIELNANWMYSDVIASIRQVQLYTRGGVFLCDVNNVDKYSKIVMKSEVNVEDAVFTDQGVADTLDDRYGESIGRTGTHIPGTAAPWANYSPYAPTVLKAGITGTANPVMNITLPLSQIKNTILALDKDLYFNEIMMLKIVWNPFTSWGFYTTSKDDPTATAAALAANIAITNLQFYLSCEMNYAIAAPLIEKVVTQGVSIVIPFVYASKYTASAATNQIVSLRLNGAYGHHLKKIYHAVFHQTETIATQYDCSNEARTRVVSYYTQVDNIRRQDFDVVTARNDDFEYVRRWLKGKVAISNMGIYRLHWFVLDKFDDDRDTETDCVDSGLSLAVEKKWDFVATTASAAYNHYSFAIVTKYVTMASGGVMLH